MPFYRDKHRGLRLALRSQRNAQRNKARRPLHYPQVNAKERFTNRITYQARRHHRRHVLQRRNDMTRYLRSKVCSQAARWRRYRQYPPNYLPVLESLEPIRDGLEQLARAAASMVENSKRTGELLAGLLAELRGA